MANLKARDYIRLSYDVSTGGISREQAFERCVGRSEISIKAGIRRQQQLAVCSVKSGCDSGWSTDNRAYTIKQRPLDQKALERCKKIVDITTKALAILFPEATGQRGAKPTRQGELVEGLDFLDSYGEDSERS